jgi:hypothetical protein
MRRLTAGLAAVGMLWVLAGCASPAGDPALSAGGLAVTTTTGRPRAVTGKQRGTHLSGRQLNLAVYYLRTFRGRRYLAPEWHPVPSTRAVAAAAVGELLEGEPYAPGARRPFPPGARLREVEIEAGTATVDLSGTACRPGAAGWGAGRCRPWSTP